VLTKRPERLKAWFDWIDVVRDEDGSWPLHVQEL
jgi:hypothetical protein